MGNLGIGTTTPGQKLDVNGTIVSSATTYPNYAYNSANRMAFGEPNVPANETGSVVQYGSGSNTRNMLFAFTKTNVNTSYFGNDGTQMMLGSEAAIPITFRTGLVYSSANVMASGAEVMRLTSAGRLGIGTAAPATALHVVGTNPLTLTGVQTGATTDSLLTITAGTVRKLPYSTVTSGASWSLTGNAGTSYATNFLGTTDNASLRFRTNNTQRVIMDSLGNVGIGTSAFDSANPEKLVVNAGTTLSVNAIYAKGTINNYFQTNIQNLSSGAQASSDIVATANNGTETTEFIDLGINGSGYVYQNGNPIETGKANDGYLISSGNDFYLVNNNTGKDMLFLTGGTATANERLRITSTGNLGIGKAAPAYKVDVKGRGSFDSTLNAPAYTSTFQTLTFGTTTTWDQTKGATATITLTGNSTLAITNAVAGMYGLIKVQQDATGSRTLTLPSGSKVINGGGGVVTLSTIANSIDILSYFYDGTNYFWTVGYSYN